MDLNTIETVLRPRDRAALPTHLQGDAWLAGGTWLFSEPQPRLRRLIDLTALGWSALEIADGLTIAATCTLAELESCAPPADWTAAAIIAPCCRALLGSFKISAMATVGGNLCLALPASPIAALAVALEATCVIWSTDGTHRTLAAEHFITGPNRTTLRPDEILRAITLPPRALRRRAALRQVSLTALGRSAALLIGTRGGVGLTLTITAATPRPVRLTFAAPPARAALAAAIDSAVPVWFDDVHGGPAWRRRITHLAAADIVEELA